MQLLGLVKDNNNSGHARQGMDQQDLQNGQPDLTSMIENGQQQMGFSQQAPPQQQGARLDLTQLFNQGSQGGNYMTNGRIDLKKLFGRGAATSGGTMPVENSGID